MNITIFVLLYPKTLNGGAITLHNIEIYVTNSVKKGILKNYVTNCVKKINNSCFTNSLRKYEKDLLQHIMYWNRLLAPQRFIC